MASIEEHPFIVMNTPASLEVLASAEMALTLWRRELAKGHYWHARARLISEKKPRCNEILVVPVPRRIRTQIDKKIVSIGRDLEEWIVNSVLNFDLFERHSLMEFSNYCKHIVADFSGSLGIKATVINILNAGELNDDVMNYKLACLYCLEDQVKRFWPAVANDPSIDANSPRDKYNLSYWSGVMKVGNSITQTELVKLRVMRADALTEFASLQRGDGIAFEYFCEMLPDDVKVSKIISWLERGYDKAVTLLSTLDRVQAEQVFKKTANVIIKSLLTNDHYSQFVRPLWTLMGHSVLEQSKCSVDDRFWTFMGLSLLKHELKICCEVVFVLWTAVFNPDYADCLNYTQCDQINDLLLEIWCNASNELKAQVSDTFLRHHFKSPLFSAYQDRHYDIVYGHNMTFLLELLSKWSGVSKRTWWQDNWQELALRSKPLYLEQFMLMCLSPNDDDVELFENKLADFDDEVDDDIELFRNDREHADFDDEVDDDSIERFKNELANFEDLFKSLIRRGFYADLKDYLLLCSEYAERFQQLGKKVLGSNLRFILIHDDDEFAQFDWFVGEVFENVRKDMDEFKSQMISSANCLKNLLAARQADEISSKDLSRIIRQFVNNEEELQLVKRKLLDHCRTYPVDYEWSSYQEFNADQWQEFLEWCTADHEEFSTFKRSLNVDVIFLKHSKDCLDINLKYQVKGLYCYMSCEMLLFLDHFFKWYFGNEEDAKNFKLEKVKNYKQIDILRVEVEKKIIREDGATYLLLKWFFDNNVENVLEFCKSCDCSVVFRSRSDTNYVVRKCAGF